MDHQLRTLERQVATGDVAAVRALARIHQRNGTRLRGLNTEQLRTLLMDACSDGCVPKVSIPIPNRMLQHLGIKIRRIITCDRGGCGRSYCSHNRRNALRVIQMAKRRGIEYSCPHAHRIERRGHRLAQQCAKRRARQIIYEAVRAQDTSKLKDLLKFL